MRPSVVGERVPADRRVDAHRQGNDEPEGDCQQAQLERDRQPAENLLLDRNGAAKQRLPEGAVQHDAADPARVLHVRRHIEAEKALELCASFNSSSRKPLGESIASTTSPGMNRMSRNTRMLTNNSVGIISSSRLMMIAATAIANGVPLYTVNPDDYQGITNLTVVAIPHPDTQPQA